MTIQITDTIRVDSGKVRKRAIATPDILSDEVTAKSYHNRGRGSDGNEIVMGKTFEYLDHKSKELEWVVYRNDGERYAPVSRHTSEADAITAAEALAEEDA